MSKQRAFVKYTKQGDIIPGSLIVTTRGGHPKDGVYREVSVNLCCNEVPPTPSFNFDITANWSLTTPDVVDEASFKTFLESGDDGDGNTNNLTDVVITDFSLIDGRLRCNLSASFGGGDLVLANIGVTSVISLGNISGTLNRIILYSNSITSVDGVIWPDIDIELDLGNNSITSVDNVTWPSGLQFLYLYNNQIVIFDPSNSLPSGLQALDLANNQITSFDPSLPLPNSLLQLQLSNNSIITFNPTTPLPSSLSILNLGYNQIVTFNPSIALPNGLQILNLIGNLISSFNPSIALPNSLLELYLSSNQILTFNPTIALPNSLQYLDLGDNQIVTFNPSIGLPDSLNTLGLNNNQMNTAGYTASEPWANAMSVIPGRGEIQFLTNINSASGTNLETILTAKGWSVVV